MSSSLDSLWLMCPRMVYTLNLASNSRAKLKNWKDRLRPGDDRGSFRGSFEKELFEETTYISHLTNLPVSYQGHESSILSAFSKGPALCILSSEMLIISSVCNSERNTKCPGKDLPL